MIDSVVPDVAPKPDRLIGMRHTVATMMFLATTISYATRVSMSVAIVAMTTNSSSGDLPVFEWSQSTKDTILSSFFWGYIILQVPAGWLAGRFGGKYLIFFSMGATGIINLLLPLAAVKGDYMAVCACRIVMGLTQGLLYPSLHGVLGHWAPAAERSRFGTFVYAGAQLGTIIELLISGILSGSSWGWPSVFYVAGITCIIWSILWLTVCDSTPGTSRWITKEERKYIESTAGSNELAHKKIATPWSSILTSLPFWAILLAHCGQNLGFWTLLTEMPTYMKYVLGVDIKENGKLSALPYVAMYLLSFFFSWIADSLVNRQIIRLVVSRKIFNTIALWGPAVALIGLSYLPTGNLSLAVIVLTITVGLNGAHYSGFMMSHIDLSPNHASTMMGFTNGMGAVFSILAPYTVSIFVKNQEAASEWRNVFFVSAAFYFLTNLFYLLFITDQIQPWNEPTASEIIDRLIGMRHIVATMMFLATTISYATRVSMSVAIVAMTTNSSSGDFPVFERSQSTKDTILSSFFWGYIILQVPAGWLAGRFGGKYLIFISMGATGIINLLLPLAAVKGDYMAVCACRIVMGLTQGLLYPSLHGVLGHWAPAAERSRFGTFVYAGAQLGTIIELLISGIVSGSSWGWPSVFYVAGITCIIWSILWLTVCDSTPGTSRWITKEERKYIESTAGSNELAHKKIATPWSSILTSLPFWAILLAHCGQNLGFWTLLTEMPTYMKYVLGVDIKENGKLSALPYVAMYLLSFFFSWIADTLVNRQIIRLVVSRKIFNTIALWGPAVALIGLSYLPTGNLSLAVIVLTITVGLNGAHYSGFMMSHIDLSPNHASTMMGFTNGMGAVFSILAPYTVSIFVKNQEAASEWRNVFFVSAAFYFLTNLFYLLFITDQIQPWNEPTASEIIEDGAMKEKTKNKSSRKNSVTIGSSGDHRF